MSATSITTPRPAIGKTTGIFILGFAAGMPYAALIGTLNAWFTAAGISMSTIGVLSWIGLAYAFKFLWSPMLGAIMPPLFRKGGLIGRWRAWILFCQLIIVGALFVIAMLNPATSVGWVALAAVVASFASATQDIAIDAWRIKIAETSKEMDAMSSVYQFGYRLSAFVAGAGALFYAGHFGWNSTYTAIAIVMALCMIGTFFTPNAPVDENDNAEKVLRLGAHWSKATRRNWFVPVLLCWAGSAIALFGFMTLSVVSETPPSAKNFTLFFGPLIIIACVIVPAVVSALVLRMMPKDAADIPGQKVSGVVDHLYVAILEPMIDLIGRLRWGAVLILLLVLSYRYADMVWGSFAYPFYLGLDTSIGAQGYSLNEVAVASKIFGVLMTITGIALGGILILRLGLMPILLIGAILSAATNLLFADLARGGAGIDGFIHSVGISALYDPINAICAFFGSEVRVGDRLARLMTAIAGENLVIGVASVANMAYLSSIVSKKYAAVQYALMASLVMLIGSLGRPWLGSLIETQGFAWVFTLTAILGLVAVVASAAVWVMEARRKTPTQLV